MDDKKHYYVEDFDYANDKLTKLTNISIDDDKVYSEEYESFVYQKITFKKWMNWFELNKEKLVWDVDKQQMDLKKD
ncbi:hypothetical protein [uncultured Flavobacterium sp.]|uniref:hypothetical protein n=1 Tax=uncultured Flavobacterium sp. TaxID=165435 RepID=UPI0030C84D67